MAGIVQAFAGMSVEELRGAADAFLRGGKHPTLGRPFHACGYAADGRAARATSRRTASRTTSPRAATATSCARSPSEIYGIPSERVIGSSNALRYLEDEHGGTITYAAEPDVFDDGPVKPIRIWSRDRPPADPRRRQLERRHPDAAVRRRQGAARAAAARPARRRRARVRLHGRRGEVARDRGRPRAGPWSASRTTGATVFADAYS